MRSQVRLMHVITALVIGLLSPHGLAASTEESAQALHRLSDSVVARKLSNGLQVLLYRRGVAPVFAGVVMVGVGGVDEVPGETGISHILEHMAFKGTSSFGTRDEEREQELLAELEEIAIQTNSARDFSAAQRQQWDAIQEQLRTVWDTSAFDRAYRLRGASGLNATTGKEHTTYFVNFPNTQLEFWAWIESERILNPVMRQFYKERDVVMEERRMRYEDKPSGKLYEGLLGVAYLEHPYRNPVIGYKEDLNTLLASKTLAFQKRFYVPSNMVVSVVGDIDPDKTFAVLEKYFGRIPEGVRPQRPQIIESAQLGERQLNLELPAAPKVYVAYKKPNYPHADDAPITVLEEVLAGSRIAPLHKSLVQKQKVATSVGVFEAPGNRYPNLFVFSLVPKAPITSNALVKKFDEQIAHFLKKGITQEQLEVAKRSIAMSYLRQLDSNLAIAQDLSSSHLAFGDWQAGMKWFSEVMAVSAADVNRVAHQYLQISQRTIASIVDERSGE